MPDDATYALERAAATTPPKSAPGRWIVRSLTSELRIGGAFVARVYPASDRGYHYEIPDMTTGWASSRYAAQRAVRKALRETP